MNTQTKLVDVIAALVTALSLWCLNFFFFTPPFLLWILFPYHAEFALSGTVCFIVIALLTFIIPETLRTHVGWFLIAVFGLVLSVYIKKEIRLATESDTDFIDFYFLEIYFLFLPSLVVMGAAHYLGKLCFLPNNETN